MHCRIVDSIELFDSPVHPNTSKQFGGILNNRFIELFDIFEPFE